MDFVNTYAKARTIPKKIMCAFAKLLGANVVTPLGRIMLLPRDYERMAIITNNADLLA